MGSQWGYDRTIYGQNTRVTVQGQPISTSSRSSRSLLLSVLTTILSISSTPGSWLQVERTLTQAKVVGIDPNPIAALDGVETLEGDLNDKDIQDKVRSMLGVVNVVVCDAAPKLFRA